MSAFLISLFYILFTNKFDSIVLIYMVESYHGVISEIRNEGRKDGRLDAERDFIKELLQT